MEKWKQTFRKSLVKPEELAKHFDMLKIVIANEVKQSRFLADINRGLLRH